MLLAVLHRHGGVACFDQDVFLNAVGGVKINEPAADLAIILAMVSSLRNKALPEKLVVFGEVGLAGEVRPVTRVQERLKEAAKLGFAEAWMPIRRGKRRGAAVATGLETASIGHLKDLVDRLAPARSPRGRYRDNAGSGLRREQF